MIAHGDNGGGGVADPVASGSLTGAQNAPPPGEATRSFGSANFVGATRLSTTTAAIAATMTSPNAIGTGAAHHGRSAAGGTALVVDAWLMPAL